GSMRYHFCRAINQDMATKYIVGSVTASFAFAYVCGVYFADKKVLGGTTPRTVADKEWGKVTEEKLDAWPRVAGKPVSMNPVTRQNYVLVKKKKASGSKKASEP
ncbi:Os04g0497300, partial [Oryza sativa Japonica Group]